MEAFEKSKMLSSLFLSRVGCLICTCKNDLLYDSRTLIPTQRSLYKWFDEALLDTTKSPIQTERLLCFKAIVDEFKQNGQIDSGTKITFLRLLKDLDSFNYSKLRRLTEAASSTTTTTTTSAGHNYPLPPLKSHPTFHNSANNNYNSDPSGDEAAPRHHHHNKPFHLRTTNLFFVKLVLLKFDLKWCSAKEFVELLGKLDNGAIRYIELVNKCRITVRALDRLTVRNFLGTVEATVEARTEPALLRAELSLKRLADSIHYRLAKQIPSSSGCESVVSSFSSHVKILLQSPPQSVASTPNESSASINDTTTSSSSFNSMMSEASSRRRSETSTNNPDTTTTTSTENTTSDVTSSSMDQAKQAKKKSSRRAKGKGKAASTSDNSSATLNETAESTAAAKGKKKGGKVAKKVANGGDSVLNSTGGSSTPVTSSPVSSASGRSPFRFKEAEAARKVVDKEKSSSAKKASAVEEKSTKGKKSSGEHKGRVNGPIPMPIKA